MFDTDLMKQRAAERIGLATTPAEVVGALEGFAQEWSDRITTTRGAATTRDGVGFLRDSILITCDPDSWQGTFINTIVNAIRYSSEGEPLKASFYFTHTHSKTLDRIVTGWVTDDSVDGVEITFEDGHVESTEYLMGVSF